MKSRFLLDVVVGECSTVLELFTGENQSLLVWRNTLSVWVNTSPYVSRS